jgi:GNAT superfamily N-acetyltransferase
MTSSQINIRTAVSGDETVLFKLIQALAEYENLTDQVIGSEATLRSHLFSDRPYAEALLAEINHTAVGFALFFYNYSTFLTKPGIYLEDLFVLPDYRSQGVGKALLIHLAQRAIAEECGRLEWSVLDWNEPAIGFYQKMGATLLPDWRICRVTGDALEQMALGKRTNP